MNDSTAELPVDTLTCALPMELLGQIAARLNSVSFALLLRPIFGTYLPPGIFVGLRKALIDNTIEGPAFRIRDDMEAMCAFDHETQSIDVSRATLEQALEQPEHSAGLLIAMLGVFAEYIDAWVRRCFSAGQAADAPPVPQQSPENMAADFTEFLLLYADPVEPDTVLAHYTHSGTEQPIVLVEVTAPVALRFGSGTGDDQDENSFGHESIEYVLKDVGFSEEDCKRIYFGNWLRDFSQLIDPKIVRPSGDFTAATVLQDLLTTTTPRVPRPQLTAIVDLLALTEFLDLQRTPEGRQDYKVDAAKLGVYRSFEHIDNPTSLDREATDPKQIDPDFQSLVFPDDPLNDILSKSSMKQYTRRPIAFMKKKMQAAIAAGQTPEGMRYFGEALHILEDYFAHSNFVELSLRKHGHDGVLVWTPAVKSPEESTHQWPIITGMFTALDILGSILDPLADIIFPTTDKEASRTPEERKNHEQAILILLDDGEGSHAHSLYKEFLEVRDKIESNWIYKLLTKVEKPFLALTHALNKIRKPLLKYAGDQIGNLSIYLFGDPNTDPKVLATHSQLSKDHDSHPFHTLAVELARHCVYLVGQAMRDQWQGKEDAQDPFKIARKLMRHPNDCSWHDLIVQQWAKENQDKVEQGKSLETLRSFQTKELESLRRDIEQALKDMEGYLVEIETLTNVDVWQVFNAPPASMP